MSATHPNSISTDAYYTILSSGVPTASGNIPVTETTFHSETGPNWQGASSLNGAICGIGDLTHSQILFKFSKTITGYTNNNLGDTTLDIAGVGVSYHDNEVHLCPVAPDGTLMTAYEGIALDLTPSYCSPAAATIGKLYLCVTYLEQLGGYCPYLGMGVEVDQINYPLQYTKDTYTFSQGYFNLVGNDIFEWGLFGKYWNDKEIAPQNDEGGGGGGFNPTDEQLTMPDLPTDGAISTHLVSVYNCTSSELQSFSQYLWSNSFFDNILKNFSSPLENIVTCHTLPIDSRLIASHAENIKVGNLSSGVASHRVNDNQQYIELDFGKINIAHMYNSFADLDTRVTLFLPYAGYTEIDVSDCMGNKSASGWLHVTYRLDILTGDFIAVVEADSPLSTHWDVDYHIIEQKTGNMASPIPISASNYMSVFTSSIGAVGQFASGNILGGVGTLMQSKPQYSKTGNIGGNVGRLGYTKPYVILHRPVYKTPDKFNHKCGVVSNIYCRLNDQNVTGFIKVKKDTFKGANIPCTQTELEMIKDLLESGVVTNEP